MSIIIFIMSLMRLLSQMQTMTREQLEAALMAATKSRAITLKVTAPKPDKVTGEMKGTSGAISAYGLGKFPITLYAGQWERLLSASDDIRAFIVANGPLLAVKA